MNEMGSNQLEFAPISSLINPSFWNKLSEIKLNDDKLNEKEHQIWGYFSNINNKCNIPILEVNSTSFNTHFESQKIYIPFHGTILNVNTIENFKEFDKTECINRVGQELFTRIENDDVLEKPSLLNNFFILSYADLKKFNFYYWFAFPVPYKLSIICNNVKNIYDNFTKDQLEHIWDRYCEMDNTQKPYFLISQDNGSVEVFELKDKINLVNSSNVESFYFVFYDLSLLENCPGSTLRNYITFILHYCPDLQGKSINFLSLRIKRNEDYKLTISGSLIFNIELPNCATSVSDFINEDPVKRWVGWEKNERGKMGPRLSNMKSFLDPKELAESSVDLNLKLMKWRLLSNIDLERIKVTKFLLLGAGTLGCSVARILLGWGARSISFVDNSVVSYSNPVRQSLFTFEDSQNSKPKSVAAAENLCKIFPGVKSKSYQMTIPMPGHPVGESMMEPLKKDVELLTQVVSDHDVIFLLMDSRESRWLPTLLGSYFNKIVINAALGFDSYLVMRHGVRMDTEELKVRQHQSGFKSLKGNFLGCYFCNDVTAPGDSMKDRTLDQQCTVTRPGVSAIAGALAAEIAISILQHKEGPKAAAFYKVGNVVNTGQEIDNQCVLGIIPHSIRGYLSSFSQVLPAVERYQQCIACSQTILDAYDKGGFDFLLQVFQNSKYLEDISGLATMNKEAEEALIWEFSDEEEVQCTDYEDNDSDNASRVSKQGELNVTVQHGISEVDGVCHRTTDDQIIRDILDNIIRNAEGMKDNDEKVAEKKSDSSITSTEYFNKILPNDILQIVRNLKHTSNPASMKESFSFLREYQEKESLTEHSSECSRYFDPTDVTLLNEKFLSSTSSIFNSASGMSNIPKELLPVLDKQSSRKSLFYSGHVTENKPSMTEIMKPITIQSSTSNTTKTRKESHNSFLRNLKVQSTSHDDTYLEFLPTESNSHLVNGNVENIEKKSGTSLMILKSLMGSFGSSASSQDVTINSASRSKSFLGEKIRRFFWAKNMKTSSESLTVPDDFNQERNDDIITIAKPQEMFRSGSLTSESLILDESIYYLAETGSSKVVPKN